MTTPAQPKSTVPVRFEPVTRADGVTPAERYLQQLCERTFLRLWSYPGLHRDQDGGKEIADLLVVFGVDIVIFSDKSCAFPNTGTLALDWSRWHRKAIRKSADQVWAAERWLLKHPNRVFLDVACSQPFPIALPPVGRARVHRVVVAHNVAEPCHRRHGGSGSLMFRPGMGSSDQTPFVVGDLDPQRGFVHVFDDTALEVVLGTLDTVADFIEYLRAKEVFVRQGHLAGAAGEEELLALYLTHGSKDDHAFPVVAGGALIVAEGHWTAFQSTPQRRAQVKANEISYAWDAMIGSFEQHALGGTSEFRSHPALREMEPALRLLAGQNRTKRRYLAQQLIDLIQKPLRPEQPFNARVISSNREDETAFVFLTVGEEVSGSRDDYRRHRRKLAEWYVMVARYLNPSFKTVVGVAMEPAGHPGAMRSEDLYVLREEDWSPEMESEARRLHEELSILKNTHGFQAKVVEYPLALEAHRPHGAMHASTRAKRGNDRNKPCACGSGKKGKRCCQS